MGFEVIITFKDSDEPLSQWVFGTENLEGFLDIFFKDKKAELIFIKKGGGR